MSIDTQGIQREHKFPEPGINCPCRGTNNKKENTNSNKTAKKKEKCKKMVAIFYRFATPSDNKNRKWYTYVKLETTSTLDPKSLCKHVGHAIVHHWFGKVKEQLPGMHVRRENLIQLPPKRFEDFTKIKPKDLKSKKRIEYFRELGITKQNIYQYLTTDAAFYASLGLGENQPNRLQNYNEKVRRANEFYVTTELYRRIDPQDNLKPIAFFTKLFRQFLKPHNMCFESGAMVFEGEKMYQKLLLESKPRAGAHIFPAQSHSMIKYVPWSRLGLDDKNFKNNMV
jgi:hypothetical protein